MKVTSSVLVAQALPAPAASAGAQVQTSAALGAAVASAVAPDQVHVGSQAEHVQAAQAQLAKLPEIDAARVAEIKAALARGDIGFDAQKIAGLVMRHHGGRG